MGLAGGLRGGRVCRGRAVAQLVDLQRGVRQNLHPKLRRRGARVSTGRPARLHASLAVVDDRLRTCGYTLAGVATRVRVASDVQQR